MAIWTPAAITTALWLDASDSATITIDTGVSIWGDKSGNGRSPANTVDVSQPSLISAEQNGLDVLRFASAFLVFPSSTATDYALKFGTGSFSLFAVVKPSSLTLNPNIFFGARGYDIGWFAGFSNSNPYFRMYNTTEQWSPAPMSAVTSTTAWQLYSATAPRGSTGKYYRNGALTQSTSATVGTATLANALQVRIGSYVDNSNATAGPFGGDIAEIIIVAGIISDEVLDTINGYLAWKWGLQASLPTGHPYEDAAPETQDYLLIHSDTTDGSTTFVDSSGNATLTAVGSVHHEVDQKRFGNTSIQFNGSTDYIACGDYPLLGSGNFTIDCWVRFSGWPANNNGEYNFDIVSKDATTGRSFAFYVGGTATTLTGLSFIGFSDNSNYTLVPGTFSFSLNTWYHIAVVRRENLIFLFVNGALLNSGGTAFSRTIQNTPSILTKIGARIFGNGFNYYLNGYIDELRITNAAEWVSNFVPNYYPYGVIPWTVEYISTDLWLDASVLPLGVLTNWIDKKGNGIVATQSVEGSKPTVAVGLNSIPNVTFDGGDFLSAGNVLNLGTESISIFVVGAITGTVSDNRSFYAKSLAAVGEARYGIYRVDSVLHSVTVINSEPSDVVSPSNSGNAFGIYNQVIDRTGGNNTLFIDGTQNATGSFTPSNDNRVNTYRFLVGAYNDFTDAGEIFYLTGNIAEFIVIRRVLGETERQKIEGYLAWKWGLQTSLPTGHPYKTAAPTTIIVIPWTPANTTTNLWLDASDASTITIATGVSQWRDKSGYNRHAAQSTGINQPTVVDGDQNGLPIISFNGSSHYLSIASFSATQPMRIFVVAKTNVTTGTTGSRQYVFDGNNSGTARNILALRGNQTNKPTLWAGSWFPHTADVTNQYALYDGLFNGSSSSIGINCVNVSGDAGTMALSAEGVIGANHLVNADWLSGGIAEIIFIYQSCPLEITQKIQGYLAWKWGLEGSLPVDHPYKSAAPIIEEYLLLVIGSVNEPYYFGITPYVDSYLESWYIISAYFVSDLTELYTSAFYGYWNEYYICPPLLIGSVNEPYTGAPILVKYWNELYETQQFIPVAISILSQLWDIAVPVTSILEQRYNITEYSGLSILQSLYDLSGQTVAVSILEQSWSIVGGGLVADDPIISSQQELIVSLIETGAPLVQIEQAIEDLNIWLPLSNQVYYSVFINEVPVFSENISVDCNDETFYIDGKVSIENPEYFPLCVINAPVRIEITTPTSSRTYHLLISGKSSRQTTSSTIYNLECKSKSYLLDSKFVPTLQREFDSALASDIVRDMAAYAGLNVIWNVYQDGILVDETIPKGFLFANNEKPLSVIRQIKDFMGGVIQSTPEGDLEIIHEYPTKVPDYETATPDYVFDSSIRFESVSTSYEQKLGTNTVNVSDQLTSDTTYRCEEEEISSTEKYVKGFHTPWDSEEVFLDTSGGDTIYIEYLGVEEATVPGPDDPETVERIEFIGGTGSTSKPIYSINSLSWVNDSLGSVISSEDGTLTADILGESLLEISYTTKYYKWKVTSPELKHVQFILRPVNG